MSETVYRRVMMTPEWAAKLRATTINRKLSTETVTRLTNDILTDNWIEDGNTIRIDTAGVLRDGQNRLAAIEQAGVPVPVVLAEGVDPAAQLVMDTGTKRNFSHWLQINGRTDTNNAAATATLLYNLRHGRMTTRAVWSGRRSISHAQLWDWFLRHEEEIYTALKAVAPVRKYVKVSSSVAAVAWLTLREIDADDTDAFFRLVAGREAPLNGTGPYLLVRRFNQRHRRDSIDQQESLALFFKAWNLWRASKQTDVLYWRGGGASQERFPEPQ